MRAISSLNENSQIENMARNISHRPRQAKPSPRDYGLWFLVWCMGGAK